MSSRTAMRTGSIAPCPPPSEDGDDVIRRQRADELRAETTFGLMGRMPDFMNALVTDAALGMRDHPTLDPAYIENLQRYQRDCRAHDWCLTHTLVDPQVDRSRGPAEQADPELVLHRVRETDAGIVVRGRACSRPSLHSLTNSGWVHSTQDAPVRRTTRSALPYLWEHPAYAFLSRAVRSRSRIVRSTAVVPLRRGDALAIFDDALVPWERVFVAGDLTAYNDLVHSGPG